MMKKCILTGSILANLVLLGVSSFLWFHRLAPPTPPVSETHPPPATPAFTQPAPQATATPSAPSRFQWSQVESPDYPTYIANLRAIACPEQTLRDIITADIANLYEQKRQMLLAQGLDAVQLPQAMEKLRQEQDALLARLLGTRSNPTASGQEARVASSEGAATPGKTNLPSLQGVTQAATVPIPVALLSPDPSLKLTNDQKVVWENLCKEFIQTIGGLNQNPNDPEYLRRWEKAQPIFDARFRVQFGQSAFIKLQNRMAQEMAPPAR